MRWVHCEPARYGEKRRRGQDKLVGFWPGQQERRWLKYTENREYSGVSTSEEKDGVWLWAHRVRGAGAVQMKKLEHTDLSFVHKSRLQESNPNDTHRLNNLEIPPGEDTGH